MYESPNLEGDASANSELNDKMASSSLYVLSTCQCITTRIRTGAKHVGKFKGS